MGKYFLENIRTHHPEAKLALVVGSRGNMIRDLFAGEPWIEVIEANRRSPASLLTLWKKYRGSDIAQTYYTASKVNLSAKLIMRAIARKLIGYDDQSSLNRYIYDIVLPLPERHKEVRLHEVDALTAAGVPVSVERLSLAYVPIIGVEKKFNITGPYMVVHLFSGSKTRGLSTQKMQELLQALAEKMPGTTLVVSGGKSDAAEAKEAAKNLPAVVIAGKASLQELMNLIVRSKVVISLDTGVGHLAAHLHHPLVIMSTCLGKISWWGPKQYGPHTPTAFFSRDDLCQHGHVFQQFPVCLSEISVEDVAHAAQNSIQAQ